MSTFTHTAAPRPVPDAERARLLQDPKFGQTFTDHMASARWNPSEGWHDLRVHGIENYSLHPGTAALHYAQEIFEGIKAFRHADGGVHLFRPEFNAQRFVGSAERLALPVLPPELFVDSVVALTAADRQWVPDASGERSLYLRPYMFGSEAFLGVRPATEVEYGVIASPTGAYFEGDGVVLWVSETYARAGRGGSGAAKCGGNYASSLAAQVEAQQHGCQQVFYVSDGDQALEESGTMNMFLVTADRELITPPTTGTILNGGVRNSVLELAVEHDLKPSERSVTLNELRTMCDDGTVTEMFASGTAAVITPIVGFRGKDFAHTPGDGTPGRTTLAIREHIVGIQFGSLPDTHGWLHRVA